MKVVKTQSRLQIDVDVNEGTYLEARVDMDNSVKIAGAGEGIESSGFWLYGNEIDGMIKLLQAAKKEINA